jgi:succinyl-diaminopimelate desuccinylase
MSTEKADQRLTAYRDEMIDLQIKLAAIPAIAPSSGGEGEARKAEAVLQVLRETGFEDIEGIKAPDLDAAAGYRPNILA